MDVLEATGEGEGRLFADNDLLDSFKASDEGKDRALPTELIGPCD